MKCRYSIACIVCLFIYQHTLAQENNQQSNGQVDLLSKYIECRDLLEAEKKKSEKLTVDLAELKKQLSEGKEIAKANLREEKEASKRLKHANDSLSDANKKLEKIIKDYPSKIRSKIDSTAKANNRMIAAKDEIIRERTAKRDSLERELNQLKDFKRVWLAQLASSVDEKWIKKPLAEVDSKDFERDFRQYYDFADADPEVANAYWKMDQLKNQLEIYQEAMRCLSSPYDREKVNSALNKVKIERDSLSKHRAAEWDSLYVKLDNYEATIEMFQDLIRSVDGNIKDMDASLIPKMAKAAIENFDQDSGVLSAIEEIPWLQETFEAYRDLLYDEERCKGGNEPRNTIMKLLKTPQ